MDSAVKLTLLGHVERQPSQGVWLGVDEMLTADAQALVRWRELVPGSVVRLDGAWGPATGVRLGADGAALVGAARVDDRGALLVTPAALAVAFSAGLANVAGDRYQIAAAAWTPDGSELWLSLRYRMPPTPKGKSAPRFDGPRSRFLVLDRGLRLIHEITPPLPLPWQQLATSDRFVAAAAGTLAIWRRGSQDPPVELTQAPPVAMGFSSDGGYFVAAEIRDVRLWSTSTWAEVARWDAGPSVALSAVAVAPGGDLIATIDAAGALRLWSVSKGVAREVASGQGDALASAMSFSPDGKRLAVASPSPPGGVALFAVER